MGRRYAGILGLLAFATTLARGALLGSGLQDTLVVASLSLWVGAAIGFLMGWIAERLVDESVSEQITAEVAQQDAGTAPVSQRGRKPAGT